MTIQFFGQKTEFLGTCVAAQALVTRQRVYLLAKRRKVQIGFRCRSPEHCLPKTLTNYRYGPFEGFKARVIRTNN